jgi:hypothetical protein
MKRLFGSGDVAFSRAATRLGTGFGVFAEWHAIRAERLAQQCLLRLKPLSAERPT